LLECADAKAARSGIIYGATCKVRKITLASAGFAETTLVYAMDPSDRTPCGSTGQKADDVYEFFSRVMYFARSPRRIISTACEKTIFFIVLSQRFYVQTKFMQIKNRSFYPIILT